MMSLADTVNTVRPSISFNEGSDRHCGVLTRDNIADYVEKFLEETYQIPTKVNACEITFLHKGKIKQWGSLTQKKKIKVLKSHALGQHHGFENDPDDALIRKKYLSKQQAHEAAVPLDPRSCHGKDHAVRVQIFTTIFAHLYNTYHPDARLSKAEILVGEYTGTGHDCERQSEGLDIYDAMSAKKTAENLREMGVSEELIREAEKAISDKDSNPLEPKSFIAKCVQSADSAEFARFCYDKPWKADKTDIYVEFQALKILKGDVTFEDFEKEFNEITNEMNSFTQVTYNDDIRKAACQTNYYKYYLSLIDSEKYPKLNEILRKMEIIK